MIQPIKIFDIEEKQQFQINDIVRVLKNESVARHPVTNNLFRPLETFRIIGKYEGKCGKYENKIVIAHGNHNQLRFDEIELVARAGMVCKLAPEIPGEIEAGDLVQLTVGSIGSACVYRPGDVKSLVAGDTIRVNVRLNDVIGFYISSFSNALNYVAANHCQLIKKGN